MHIHSFIKKLKTFRVFGNFISSIFAKSQMPSSCFITLAAATALLITLLLPTHKALAAYSDPLTQSQHDITASHSAPLSLQEIENLPKENKLIDQTSGLPFDIRKDAIREAAISYGARAGLAMRTYEIRQELKKRESYMDEVFDFRHLLIAAPSGLLIEPPIITEAVNALLIDNGGQEAAVSDRIYNIMANAKIVSTSRTWRSYLEREWGNIEAPPDILRPENKEERQFWIEMVNKGWEKGYEQADEVFEQDLMKLTSDFQGMVRYRMLLSQGMISPPYALQIDRGITGGGSEMRIGDRAVQITGMPQLLVSGAQKWQPASR